MKRKIIFFLNFILFISLFSCSGKHKVSDSDSSANADLMKASDSISADSIVEPEKPLLRTTSEILEYINNSPDKEKYEKGIIPAMAEDVPKYAAKLLNNDKDGFLIVDKNTMKCYRYDVYGVLQESVGIACARPYGSKHKRRDNRTPEGFFEIEGIYDSTDWLYTDDDGNTSEVKGQFGPRFMRVKNPVSSQIGIHGTCSPWSIGGRRSHGCIRMTNENILRFAEICKAGWPVIISPGPYDMAVNEEEGYDIPSVSVLPGKPRCKASKRLPGSYEKKNAEQESVKNDSIENHEENQNIEIRENKEINDIEEQKEAHKVEENDA